MPYNVDLIMLSCSVHRKCSRVLMLMNGLSSRELDEKYKNSLMTSFMVIAQKKGFRKILCDYCAMQCNYVA